MLKRILILLMMIISLPSFATDVTGGETCDTDVLNTDTGPVNLRAEFEPEVINLKWYNGNNQITVPTASNSCTYDTPISLPANPVKPGYKFKGWKVFTGIPIEYLQSNGNEIQYIDTGIPGDNDNYNIIVDFMINQNPVNPYTTYVFYTPGPANSNVWRIIITNTYRLLFYTNTHSTYPRSGNGCNSGGVALNERTVVSVNYNNATINGVQNNYCSYDIGQPNNSTIRLFSPDKHSIRIYSFKIYDNGTLIRDMVPVKDLSGVACMYDKVSGQFFYNSGTGNFVAGPDL